MSDLPPLTALRSFEAVARLGSISQAASELHVTHSAISQQIKLLENLLGLALFVREGRGLRLSENGRFYALQVRASLGEIADATRVVRARPREGELVVTVMPSFGLNWLLPRLPRFRERHPHCRVRLVASLDVQNLRQGLADLGVRIGKGDWEGVGRERLFDDELLMVAAPDFNGGRLPRTPSEIVACPTLRSTESWALWCQRAGVAEPQHGLLINDSNLLLEAVRLGQGIALERRSLVAGALAEGRLVQLGAIRVPYPYPYWLVWPQREPPSDRHQAFADWLREEARRYQAEQPPLSE
ncbi:LysR family transcriptional regulator [Pseudomonas aeruginosa]|nr:LysR family transcriptional regulator [Pseudomonas aeruginosa]MBG4802889.1 LysR family transcriptional regulator [Pseudomonas aeruginosa]MBG6833563.1 LysR family transcriptional regulator [Pseudomonas aeruginosa]